MEQLAVGTANFMRTCVSRMVAVLAILLPMSLAATAEGASQTVRFVTFNVNFNNTNAEIEADVKAVAPRGDIIMYQEAKGVTVDNFLDTSWTVFQIVNNGDARRGSAIAVRNSVMSEKLAQGLRFGVDSNGENMLDRYIAWMDVKLTNGRILRVMSLHMPPASIAYLQPPMADNFVAFVAESPYPVIAGGDWNFTVNNDPLGIQGRTGLVPRGVGIDGFYRDNSVIKFTSITEMTGLNVNSDHDPVQMITSVEAVQSGVEDWELY